MRSVYGCIYAAWNPDRTKVYVGQTTKTPAERWAEHVKFARMHKGCPKLGDAIRKHGDQMVVEPLDVAECQADLDFLEVFYICTLDAVKHGYNCQAGGGGGRLLDEEAKERHRASIKVALARPGVRASISSSTRARYAAMTEEEWAEWRANNKAAQNHPETKVRKSIGVRAGQARMSDEARAEMRANNKAVLNCPETKTRASVVRKAYWTREEAAGRILQSPETREQQRLYHAAWRARKRAEKEGVPA